MNNPAPKPRRRWFAFSLRTLLALVTLAAVVCGAFVVYVKPYRDEQRAWEKLRDEMIKEQEAAQTAYLANVPFVSRSGVIGVNAELVPDEAVPGWLRQWAGEKNFLVLRSVEIPLGVQTNEIINQLARFKHLQSISFRGSDITDDGLKWLAHHPRLRKLDLSNTAVTDAGLSELRGCKQLRVLDVRRTDCTFAGLRKLAALPLETVHVNFPLTDEVLRSGPPLQAIVPDVLLNDGSLASEVSAFAEHYLVVEQVSAAGLSNLATMHFWNQAPRNYLKIRDSSLTAAGLDAVLPLPIKSLALENCRLERAEQLRLMRREGRPSIQVQTDSTSLDWETFADVFLSDAREMRLDTGGVRTAEAELIYVDERNPRTWCDLFQQLPLAELESIEAGFAPPAELLECWAKLPRLTLLECEAELGTDLRPLRAAPALETLSVVYQKQPPEFWRFVRELPRLRELQIRRRQETAYMDARAMRELAAESGLLRLLLRQTGVDDDGIAQLAAMTKLERLDLISEHWVTVAGIEKLRQRLPELIVETPLLSVSTPE